MALSRFIPRRPLALLTILVGGMVSSFGATPTGLSSALFTNLNKLYFSLDLSAAPTNIVKGLWLTNNSDSSISPSGNADVKVPGNVFAGTVVVSNLTTGNAVLVDQGDGTALLTNGAAAVNLNALPPLLATLDETTFSRTNFFFSNLTATTHDVWTVPAGDYACVAQLYTGTTNTTGAYLFYNLVKTNGTYYWLGHSANTYNTNAYQNMSSGYLFEENETIAYTNTVSGLNAVVRIFYWPKAGSKVTACKFFGVTANTTNTIYTCPANKYTHAWENFSSSGFPNYAGVGPTLYFQNNLGSAIVGYSFLCPSGTSPGYGTLARSQPTAANSNPYQYAFPALYPGDVIAFSADTSSTTSIGWLNVVEANYPP